MPTVADDLQLRRGYPRPQLRRSNWQSLNGPWKFAIDPLGRYTQPDEVVWTGRIEVPFAPETPASGIGDTSFYRAVWYSRQLERPSLPDDHCEMKVTRGLTCARPTPGRPAIAAAPAVPARNLRRRTSMCSSLGTVLLPDILGQSGRRASRFRRRAGEARVIGARHGSCWERNGVGRSYER